jgi:hypothetical protein
VLRRLAIVVVALAALLQAPPPLFAAGQGVISGTLQEKTPGASLQAGGKAFLYKLPSGQNPEQAGQADVDAGGHFRFDALDTDPAVGYEIGVQYQGAPYFSDKLSFGPGETSRGVSLDVYETTDDDSVLSLAGASLLVDPDEKTHQLAILELDTFDVAGRRTFLPNTTPRNGGPPPLLRFSLPPNATDLTPSQGLSPDEVIQIGTGFGALAPLPPGRHDVSFSFHSQYQTSSTSFTKNVIYATKTFRVLLPVGQGQVDSPNLRRQALQNIGGKQYQLLSASDLAPGARIELRFSSLPGINPLTELAQPSTLPWLAGCLGVVVLGLMAWYLRDRRRSPAPALAADRQSLEAQRRDLLVTLARLDDRHDAGKVSDEDYHSQRDVHKAELRSLIQEIESLG